MAQKNGRGKNRHTKRLRQRTSDRVGGIDRLDCTGNGKTNRRSKRGGSMRGGRPRRILCYYVGIHPTEKIRKEHRGSTSLRGCCDYEPVEFPSRRNPTAGTPLARERKHCDPQTLRGSARDGCPPGQGLSKDTARRSDPGGTGFRISGSLPSFTSRHRSGGHDRELSDGAKNPRVRSSPAQAGDSRNGGQGPDDCLRRCGFAKGGKGRCYLLAVQHRAGLLFRGTNLRGRGSVR
mmetsp:Transcript_13672/g.15631  ORF Transcript_13672/g.15631 Transcript_13672/m.15631 type:complete len:234 (+) Transcript_13672:381-1082(+)